MLGRAAVCDCGAPWTFLVHFFRSDAAVLCWEGLRFVIVALPGLFSYTFFRSDAAVLCWEGLRFVIVAFPGLFSTRFATHASSLI